MISERSKKLVISLWILTTIAVIIASLIVGLVVTINWSRKQVVKTRALDKYNQARHEKCRRVNWDWIRIPHENGEDQYLCIVPVPDVSDIPRRVEQ